MATTISSHRNYRKPAALPDDVLIEILARVPYKDICRFKCASSSWLALCSCPDDRKRSPLALAGFFCYSRHDHERRFLSTSGNTTRRPPADPSFPFLRAFKCSRIDDCCNGLLLCSSWTQDGQEYVVCNPTTEKCLVLPRCSRRIDKPHAVPLRMHLGFEPAVSSHFTVFVFWITTSTSHQQPSWGVKLGIYSSEAGEWTYRQTEWGTVGISTDSFLDAQAVFLNGTLHMTTFYSTMLTVDKDGTTWRKIQMPLMTGYGYWSIGCSQGCLYATHVNHINVTSQLTVFVLEDCESDPWVVKHTASLAEVFGKQKPRYYVLAFCPDRNTIFLTELMGKKSDFISYDMDTGKGHVVCSLEDYYLPEPYTPCFVELMAI